MNGQIISIQPNNFSKTPMGMSADTKDIFFNNLSIKKGQVVKAINTNIFIDKYSFSFKYSRAWNPKLDIYISSSSLILIDIINLLSNILKINQKDSGIEILKPNSLKELVGLIGMGIGLTPSGDDFLVGFLSTLFTFEEDNKYIKNYRESLIKEIVKSLDKTTFLSKEFLQYACNREFSQIIHEFYITLENNDPNEITISAMELLKLGYSSGSDTLKGIISGMLFIHELKP